ncbi:ankyrin-1-like [Schistocerca americana]|uniref:ankyrin-1-like n=1 Tax=Schistocerca americana TaxID=7009 RepID=UPI001F4FEC0B|nr:ankyrin-1-like [Schistocerca americana]
MSCTSVTWFICIFAALVTVTNYSDADSISGSDPEVTAYRSRADNQEPPTADLARLLDSGVGAVVWLVAGDTRLVAHRAVLAARSPVLAAMLRDDSPEASSGRISISDVEGPVLRQLVAYMYTLRAPQLPDVTPQLAAAADRYGLPALKAACEQQLAAQLSAGTAAAAAVLAVRRTSDSLRQAVADFVKAHLFHVMPHTVRGKHRDVTEASHQHSDPFAETSTAAAAAAAAAAPTTLPHSDRSHHGGTPSPACHTPTPDDAAISLLRNLSAEEKDTRLILAAKNGAVQQMQALLAAGADVGAEDSDRNTALHWAAWEGHLQAVGCLLGAGADVDAGNWVGNTPLHWAAWGGREAVVRLLASSAADLDARNRDGMRPLHEAAKHGHAAAVAALLDAGADRRVTTGEGYTPLDLARQHNHDHLVDILSSPTDST